MPTALFSVYDKGGVTQFAKALNGLGWKLLASGGTAKAIADANISVTDIAGIVGEPILGHRVVTLSREIHAGLLAQNNAKDRAELDQLGIEFIDLVYINLYPLMKTMADPNATFEMLTEQTDIGGPAMLRSAAKGGRLVVVDAEDIPNVLIHLKSNQGMLGNSTEIARRLAEKAERTVAAYGIASAVKFADGNLHTERILRTAYQQLTGQELLVRFQRAH